MAGRFKAIPTKGILLTGVRLGGGRYTARRGDVVLYAEGERYRLARVIELVTHDHEGREYREPSRWRRALRPLPFSSREGQQARSE